MKAEDIFIVIVDSIAVAEFSSPSLTTVAQPFKLTGKLDVQRPLHTLQDPKVPAPPFSLTPELPIRASTGKSPALRDKL